MDNTFISVFILVSLIQAVRYLLAAGIPYYFLWVRHREKNLQRKIQSQPYDISRIQKEIWNSIGFSIISGAFFALPFLDSLAPYSKLYTDASEHSIWWLFLSVPFLVVLQDTYFYWMHRALHTPLLYRFHKVHHDSRDPSPFTSYSFHWVESIFEVAWFIPLMFLIPFHHGSLFAFGMIALIFNVNGHLGVDLYPASWKTHPVLKWLNTSTNHNNHHRYFKGNYGFFFMFWDNFMDTKIKNSKAITHEKAA